MPELKTTLEEARRMIATADGLLKTGVNGTLDQLNTTLEELRRPLATADAVLKNADTVLTNTDATLLGKNAPIQQDLRDALQEVTLAARALRVLMDYLERHPDSLLRGK
jgi:paraquat-inducible protein B